MTSNASKAPRNRHRLQLVRDVAVFQLKLIVDGFRDLLLVPASLVAGIASFLHSGPGAGAAFYDLLRLGARSEEWINLFAAANRDESAANETRAALPADIDELVTRVEAYVVQEYRSGEITAQAKKRLGRLLQALRSRGAPPP